MTVVPTEKIRNVIVLGHTGTGKSTLVEAMLRVSGHASGPVDGCPTVDGEPEEQDRGHSLSLAVASLTFDGHTLNVLDAPGGAEAIGDAYPGLPAADLALFVIDGTVGVQPQHAELWQLCERHGTPRAIFLNKMDLARAQHPQRLAELLDTYGSLLALVQLPLEHHDELEGVIDIVHGRAIDEHAHDGTHVPAPVPEDRRDEVDEDHRTLLESVIEHDDDLLVAYLDGQTPSDAEFEGQLARDIAAGTLVPVLCGSAAHDIGVEPLLHFLVDDCPPPRPLDDVGGATVAYVAKTLTDPYVGRISVLRLLAGDLAADDELVVARTGESVRAHNLVRLIGREQTPIEAAAAGDLVAVPKLGDVVTGDVLTSADASVKVDAPEPPPGFHRVVFEPATASDDAKLSTALERLMQEDPSIQLTLDHESSTRVLSFLGPTHVDVTVDRLARAHGVAVEVQPAPIPYRETIRRKATAQGRHVKQSGGHGQYGIVTIEIAPRRAGEGFSFTDDSVGGVVPKQYVGAVEKGVVEAMQDGPLGGHQVVDVAVRLLDGKHHSVDSSDAAFRMAGILAFRAAIEDAVPVLLEPIAAVTIRVPDDLTGAVLSDLASRRGRILGTTSSGGGWTLVESHVPEAELVTFTAEFRALTSGRGQMSRDYDHHDEVPKEVSRRVVDTPAGPP